MFQNPCFAQLLRPGFISIVTNGMSSGGRSCVSHVLANLFVLPAPLHLEADYRLFPNSTLRYLLYTTSKLVLLSIIRAAKIDHLLVHPNPMHPNRCVATKATQRFTYPRQIQG
jgi:hypothetical protein